VIGSFTESSWLCLKSANRLRGWCADVGSSPASGCSPVSCAGTASGVVSETVVALRYHVAPSAKRAMFGNSAASIVPSAPVNVEVGSSSSTMWTIGVEDLAGPETEPEASPGITRSETGENARKSTRKTSGAGDRTVRNARTASARA
jgi:hypothetical protein